MWQLWTQVNLQGHEYSLLFLISPKIIDCSNNPSRKYFPLASSDQRPGFLFPPSQIAFPSPGRLYYNWKSKHLASNFQEFFLFQISWLLQTLNQINFTSSSNSISSLHSVSNNFITFFFFLPSCSVWKEN